MDTKALRQKILDLAIRGKLVPQDPNDEPASVLLEKIREEKARMVKEGKLKKKDIKNDSIIYVGEDNLHYEKFQDGTVKCIEDEIPFKVPNGWVWTRLGNLCAAIQYGLSNSAEPKGSHKFLRITDIQNGTVNWDTVPFTRTSDPDVYLLKPGDIVFARTGATVGKSFLITETPYPSVYASYLIRIRLLGDLLSEYIYQFFDSACYWSQITDKSVGVGQPNCNGTALKELFIPLPPINEQLRIIPTVRKLLKRVTKIDTEEKALISIVTAAKAKILDLAIRGKLVPQNPDDEPASALLERIRTEREELIKQGKIKRDKKESFIFKGEDNSYYEKIGNTVENIDSEIPFELPDGWEFVRLKELWELISGRDLSSSEYNAEGVGIPYITGASNFTNGKVELVRWTTSPQVITKTGDLLLTCKGTIGEMAFNNFGDAHIARQIMAIRNTFGLNPEYLALCMAFHISAIKNAAKGLIPGISREDILSLILPVPPRAYQTKVVKQMSMLTSFLISIEKSLN